MEKRVESKVIIAAFARRWEAKYKVKFVTPSSEDIKELTQCVYEAQSLGYSAQSICNAMDAYLEDDFEGYAEQGHPIRFLSKGMLKRFIFKGRMVAERLKEEQTLQENARDSKELMEKYGIMKLKDTFILSNGKAYVTKEQAIAAADKLARIRKGVKI